MSILRPLHRSPNRWTVDRMRLFKQGMARCKLFCEVNKITMPTVHVIERKDWHFDVCAFYRPEGWRETSAMRKFRKKMYENGINICLEMCAMPCRKEPSRNWNWPGSVIDRTPYGVLAHELGHHCDWLTGEKKWAYGSEYSTKVMEGSNGEKSITSYGEQNPAEWFAEAFRLFITNPKLLKEIRTRTYWKIRQRFNLIDLQDWRKMLGKNVPPRVISSLENKGAK